MVCESAMCAMKFYVKATVPQIKGGFINLEWDIFAKVGMWDEIAGCACFVFIKNIAYKLE